MFSIFPWPNGCSSSAGLPAERTAKRAISAAKRSTAEWIASEITETEPISRPKTTFAATSRVLEATESAATATFLFWGVMVCTLSPPSG